MKKFFKFVGSVTLLCATVAGGIFAYKKFFAPDPFEDDFDDDLEDSAETDDAVAGRGYVSLTSEESDGKDEEAAASETEAVEDTSEEETTETEV